MFRDHSQFVILIVSVGLKGITSFFAKELHSSFCINDTGQIVSSGNWGNLSILALSKNSCFDPSAQFRFRDNGAMLNLKRKGCVAAFNRNGSGYNLDLFYLFVDSVSLDTNACAQKPNESIYRAIKHNRNGALSVYYKGRNRSSYEIWRARNEYSDVLWKKYRTFVYIELDTNVWNPFRFGSVTCYGKMVVNANCPKDQYMEVRFASYRGLPTTKKCGSSNEYICKVDVTCLVKKKCDGLHECNITVDGNFISSELCPGLSSYLYFEYDCVDSKRPFQRLCVHDVFLSHSSGPSKGVLQVEVDKKRRDVCSRFSDKFKATAVCRSLGYTNINAFYTVPFPKGANDAALVELYCHGYEMYLSLCRVDITERESCPELAHIECGSFKLLLDDKQRFANSSFSASAFSNSHPASNARASSGSSWCTPVADGEHYLQVDLGRLYRVDYLVTYGDSTNRKWVATYNLNYTIDLINWKSVPKVLQGNKNAFYQAAEQFPDVEARALRLIPLTFVKKPCLRVDFGGKTVFPDKPTNLIVTNITSRSAAMSWSDPKNHGAFNLSQFWIQLKKNNSLELNFTTEKVNKYQINNLIPSTAYKISVSGGNSRGFGKEIAIKLFFTHEEAPSGTPLSIQTISRSASSLFIIWHPPEKSRRNGVIVSYTACILHSEYGACLQTFTTSKRDWLVGNLNSSTIYYVRVLASTKVGPGNYSESKRFFTNGEPAENENQTSKTLTFLLKIPTKTFLYFFVVALKQTNAQEILSPDNYEDIDLVTYDGVKNKTNPKPYVAAVFTPGVVDENIFVLGDGRITDDPTSRTTSDYFNGPLEPSTSYRIFQRVIINKQGDHYSTDWSFAAITSDTEDRFSGNLSTDESDGSKQYFLAIVGVLASLLVISFVFIAYLVYESRLKSQATTAGAAGQETADAGNNSQNVNGSTNRIDVSAYEQVGDEQLYTDLHRSGVGENDDRSYANPNQVADVYVMQEETGI